MKMVVVGLGYVGSANATILAQHCEVIGVDVSPSRVALLHARKSPIGDQDLPDFLAAGDLNLSATTNLHVALPGSDYVIIATPTNYDEKLNFFDTRSVEDVAAECMQQVPEACLVIKSTIPVGFVDGLCSKLQSQNIRRIAQVGRTYKRPDLAAFGHPRGGIDQAFFKHISRNACGFFQRIRQLRDVARLR